MQLRLRLQDRRAVPLLLDVVIGKASKTFISIFLCRTHASHASVYAVKVVF
ncbi:MAG: hypothetical protein ACKERG_00140 [Candidatus Hodgkinia cicadicola]